MKMDDKALALVSDYVHKYAFDGFFGDYCDDDFLNIFIVWKCKTIQNWKWLICTNLRDGMYYEVTYNGDKGEFYLDAYKKVHKVIASDDSLIFQQKN